MRPGCGIRTARLYSPAGHGQRTESTGLAAVGDPKGYYDALGVERTASAEDVKAAFRQRAKLLHPDGNGAVGDEEAFRLLREAYEALRYPHDRLRYDADALAGERRQAAEPPEPAADASPDPSTWPDLEWLESSLRWLGPQALPVAIPILAMALLVAIGLLGVAWSRVEGRDRAIAELSQRMETTRATVSSDTGRGADGYPMPQVFQGGFGFPPGSADLDPATRASLDAVAGGLRRAIGGLPSGRAWLVSVESGLASAADRRGLLVADWELAVSRLRVTAEYLVGQGIPAERLIVRFHAGAPAPPASASGSHDVALKLVCCLAAKPG